MQYSRTAIINVITHILISGGTYKQVRVDWIMDNLYFNYDIFNLNMFDTFDNPLPPQKACFVWLLTNQTLVCIIFLSILSTFFTHLAIF
jgi:hypothetical protein